MSSSQLIKDFATKPHGKLVIGVVIFLFLYRGIKKWNKKIAMDKVYNHSLEVVYARNQTQTTFETYG
jgi:hypothetical protein